MTASLPERRRVQRVAVTANSWLALPTSWSVELIDIGMAGLSFSSVHPLEVGRTVYVTATLGREAFNSSIQVCWCRQRKAENNRQSRFEVGATLQHLEDNNRRTLWRFLRITPSE